ncbi:MAG TPA: cyclic nucleotide-binding domain-containing protein [Actinomycetota bacterium]|jgi:CRP-like cAMP-binding protein
MTVTIDQLRGVPLFNGLKDSDLERIAAIGKEVTHEAGRAVVEEDHTGVGFHLIIDGEASVTVHGRDVGTFGPGSYFGEMSVIDGGPRSATVTPVTDLLTFSIPAWNFQELMDTFPSMMKALLIELCARIRRIDEAKA